MRARAAEAERQRQLAAEAALERQRQADAALVRQQEEARRQAEEARRAQEERQREEARLAARRDELKVALDAEVARMNAAAGTEWSAALAATRPRAAVEDYIGAWDGRTAIVSDPELGKLSAPLPLPELGSARTWLATRKRENLQRGVYAGCAAGELLALVTVTSALGRKGALRGDVTSGSVSWTAAQSRATSVNTQASLGFTTFLLATAGLAGAGVWDLASPGAPLTFNVFWK